MKKISCKLTMCKGIKHGEKAASSKETDYAFLVLSFWSIFYMFLCISKDLKFRKVKVSTNRSSSPPQKALLLKRLVRSPAFNYVTLWRHTTSQSYYLHNLCLAESLTWRNWFSRAALLLLMVLCQACVSWPTRADWVFEGGGLKETGAI